MNIDINCDMGESYGNFKVGNDEEIMPWINSCNIACGFHGGDPLNIIKTIALALEHEVRIGAHPSYPDLAGFGRRNMKIPHDELLAIIKYQISALKGLAESMGGKVHYVKPHGALYNTATRDEKECRIIIQAIREIDESLMLMGLAGSIMENIAKSVQMPFIAEAFADRRYTADGKLMSRSLEEAVITDSDQARAQVQDMVLRHKVKSHEGSDIEIHAQSFCVHGDNPSAVAIVRKLNSWISNQNAKG